MARVNKAASKASGSPLFTGIMVGMIIGVAMAAGLAWFIMKSPSPFVLNEQHVNKPQETKKPVEHVKPHEVKQPEVKPAPAATATAASGVDESKPRFEFYKVLTDKTDTSSNGAPVVERAHKPAEHKPEEPKMVERKPVETKPVEAKPTETKPVEHKTVEARPAERKQPDTKIEPLVLQVAAFPSLEDAEKSKAALALQGLEANIQSATIPNKGVWYRVRLGPYKTAEELNRARVLLKQSGVNFTSVRTQ